VWRYLCAGFFLTAIVLGPLQTAELQTIDGVTLLPTEWADGDSFRVRFPDGSEQTLRLYGADCIEWHVTDSTDARRLRAQRRYFGISGYGGSPEASIELAKKQGETAAAFVREALQEPFTVHTAFADGRGDSRYQRVYAFVETAGGSDLATLLVREGLARAYGVYRTTPDGSSHEDYREQLKDAELIAARRGVGAWEYTNWETLSAERQDQRREEAEEQLAIGKGPAKPVDLNRASRDELMALPGVGEVTANRIIESRPYSSPEDLLRVNGIGPRTLEGLRPYLMESE